MSKETQIKITEELYNFIKKEAKENHRTIKGQTEHMLLLGKSALDEYKRIQEDYKASQLDISAFQK